MKMPVSQHMKPLTAPGGLVQSGGYMQRSIDIKSRRFPQKQLPKSGVGGGMPMMPKGMD